MIQALPLILKGLSLAGKAASSVNKASRVNYNAEDPLADINNTLDKAAGKSNDPTETPDTSDEAKEAAPIGQQLPTPASMIEPAKEEEKPQAKADPVTVDPKYWEAVSKLMKSDDVLSDEECKEIIAKGPEAAALMMLLSGEELDDNAQGFIDGLLPKEILELKEKYVNTDEEPNLADLYKDYIKTYLYNYKPGMGEDPSEQHIGPTAQEIEKVDPSLVKTDEDEHKRVDTSRLPLTNASAIADLAREVADIQDELNIGDNR